MSKSTPNTNDQNTQQKSSASEAPKTDVPAANVPVEKATEEKKVVLVGTGFELAFNLADLIVDNEVDVTRVENEYLSHKFHKTIPASLESVQIPRNAIIRYVKHVVKAGIDPSTVWLVIADPAVDETLKTINLMRAMSDDLPPTFFYPSFDADKHLHVEGV